MEATGVFHTCKGKVGIIGRTVNPFEKQHPKELMAEKITVLITAECRLVNMIDSNQNGIFLCIKFMIRELLGTLTGAKTISLMAKMISSNQFLPEHLPLIGMS